MPDAAFVHYLRLQDNEEMLLAAPPDVLRQMIRVGSTLTDHPEQGEAHRVTVARMQQAADTYETRMAAQAAPEPEPPKKAVARKRAPRKAAPKK